jgi:multiple sugar transport system substrate-binding protein
MVTLSPLPRCVNLALLTALALTACAPPTATPISTPAPLPTATVPSDVVRLRVGVGDSGDGLKPHEQIAAEYAALHPDAQIQIESVTGNDYYATLLQGVKEGTGPDLMQLGDDAVRRFVDEGAILPIDDCLKTTGTSTDNYLSGLLQPGQVAGVQYLLPKDYTTLAVYYNKKLFDAAGEPYPSENWTWQDLLKTAQALTQDTNNDGAPDTWGLQLPASWTTGFEYWVAAAGGQLISQNGKHFTGYMDSPAAISAAQFYADLYNHYQVAVPPADFNAWGGGNTDFQDGKAAMMLFGHWRQAGFMTNPNIALGVVAPPQLQVRANILFWAGFAIARNTPNPEAACEFLIHYAGTPSAKIWKDWGLPFDRSVVQESLAQNPLEQIWVDELNYLVPRAYTYTPYWNETADPALRQALETLITDPAADVTATMQQAAREAQAKLEALAP